jgi:hypothetical protein
MGVLLQATVIALNRYGNPAPVPKPVESDREAILKSEFNRVL